MLACRSEGASKGPIARALSSQRRWMPAASAAHQPQVPVAIVKVARKRLQRSETSTATSRHNRSTVQVADLQSLERAMRARHADDGRAGLTMPNLAQNRPAPEPSLRRQRCIPFRIPTNPPNNHVPQLHVPACTPRLCHLFLYGPSKWQTFNLPPTVQVFNVPPLDSVTCSVAACPA